MNELKIEMPERSDLIDLQQFLNSKLDENTEVQEINDISPGFNREPLIIGLIIALGGPVIVIEVAALIKEWMKLKHEEKKIKLSLLTKNGKKTITLEELEKI